MIDSFKKLFQDSIKKKNIKNGAIIKGKIIKIKKEYVIIDAGLKSEAYIPIEQFKNNKGLLDIKLYDKVDVSIDNIESGYGETILSREKAKKHEIWLLIEKIYLKNKNINGIITNKVKGGFTVDLNGIKSFLPGSLIDIKPIKNSSDLEGKNLKFKIIKLDKKKNNIVVSRKAVILNENKNEREKLIKSINEGIILKGIVKNLTNYGAFIDLGLIDGLLHITDISWKRIKHPNEILEIGQKINVKVIKFDKEKTRVSLGLKQLTDDPWESIYKKYPINTKIIGKVTNITDYGCFLEIEKGIEGLAHISEIDWINKNINPFKNISIGEKIETMILNIDKEKRRISLGLKQCKPNPWILFSKKYKKGDKIEGKIKSITDFGIFIGLKNGIDGLIHKSDISWNNNKNEFEYYKKNNKYKKENKIKSIILQIDPEKERISLGLKQLKEDPINKYIKINKKNKIIKSKIIKIKNKKINVLINENIDGIIKIKEKEKFLLKKIKINDILETKINNIDKKNRIIELKIYKNKKILNNKNRNKKIEKNCFNTMIEAFKKAKNKN